MWPPAGAQPVDADVFYAALHDRGYQFGPVFHCVRSAWLHDGEVYADVALPESEHLGLWAGFLWGAVILLALTAAWEWWRDRRAGPVVEAAES